MAELTQIQAKAARLKAPPNPAMRKAIRTSAGLGQRDIAEALGVQAATVSRWEAGARTPRGNDLDAYLAVLSELIALGGIEAALG